jgi:CheY-like chemotaxis protein
VRNLVDNAVRYTDRGGVHLRARILSGQRVRVQVWDSGSGIAPADQQRIFEPFVRLQQDQGNGQGLGLAIVQRSAALLGATVRLRSRPGRGSCFSITLPLLAGAARQPAAAPAPAPADWLAGQRLLLVEDDAAVRAALLTRLQAWGAEVFSCDGLLALQRLLAGELGVATPDGPVQATIPAAGVGRPVGVHLSALITDLRLPGANGFEVSAAVRQALGPTLPVLVITGNTAPQDLLALSDSGLAVLHKPFRAEQLQAALQRLLEGRRPPR